MGGIPLLIASLPPYPSFMFRFGGFSKMWGIRCRVSGLWFGIWDLILELRVMPFLLVAWLSEY